MDNKQIMREMDKRVYGHEEAKKVLINIVKRAKLRYELRWNQLAKWEDLPSTSNCLLIGQSGTGKTHLVESLSRVMNFPLMCVDATSLTRTSAVGGISAEALVIKIQKYAARLVEENKKNADNQYYSVQGVLDQMVIFVDEIDKLGIDGCGGWNQGTQASFLRFFENKTELTSLSFVFAGAFSTIKQLHETKQSKSIGFHNFDIQTSTKDHDLEAEIIKSGIMPELVGRMGNIIRLDQLTEDQYGIILDTIIIPKKIDDLYKANIIDGVDEALYDGSVGVAQAAYKSSLGVRYMIKAVDKLALDIEFYADEPTAAIKRLECDAAYAVKEKEEDIYDYVYNGD